MKKVVRIAESIIDQWENHDRYRVTEGEKLLFSNQKEPDDVVVARAFLQAISLLKDALPNHVYHHLAATLNQQSPEID